MLATGDLQVLRVSGEWLFSKIDNDLGDTEEFKIKNYNNGEQIVPKITVFSTLIPPRKLIERLKER